MFPPSHREQGKDAQATLKVLICTIRQEKGNKRHTDWKRKIKLSILMDNMIVYGENPKRIYQKLLRLINKWNQQSQRLSSAATKVHIGSFQGS